MKEFSKETIEINGQEYTLFLNRKGVVAIEKFSRAESQKLIESKNKIEKMKDKITNEFADDYNPFEDSEVNNTLETMDENEELAKKIYSKIYYVLLYTNYKEEHKEDLTISKARELYNLACDEYGIDSVNELAEQMIEDANINRVEEDKKEQKKLNALRPKK